MGKVRILLLKPTGDDSAPEDQSLGAYLAATQGPTRDQVDLEQDSFQRGAMDHLEKVLRQWADKISGVVGATNVPESKKLGEMAEELNLLCFVSNNNPEVWQHRSHIFHIGVPTTMIGSGIAEGLLRDVGFSRVYLLHDSTEFQRSLASATARSLEKCGVKVRSQLGSLRDWLDDVRSWKPDLLYLVYSNESPALPLAQSLRRSLPEMPLLVGMSLLRHTFLSSLGEVAEGVLCVDIFQRRVPQREQEKIFMSALRQAGVRIHTANHGFGWDAMILCGKALSKVNGTVSSAIQYLESGINLEGATGYYRFGRENHNGRVAFSPILLSRVHNDLVEPYAAAR